MRKLSSFWSRRLAAVALGGALAVAGSAMALSQKSKPEPSPTTASVTADSQPVTPDADQRFSFAPVVKRVSPGVVKVVVTSRVQNMSMPGGGIPNDLWHRFFGDTPEGRMPWRNFGAPRNVPMPRQEGVGSGVIASKDGYILTNNHVVDGADEVKVSLQDGREFTAKIIGRDPKSDLAVIKIDGKNLPVVPMGNSDKLQVGDVVLAIGNPYGIGQTVTSGIVSAKDRASMGLDYEDFIQTDAAINPGNSGGALVDADGRLVGINTAIYSRSGGNQGIGFAIPINLAKDVMEDLIKDGHVTRGYLGVMIQDLNPALAKAFDVKSDHGALIGEVNPNTPADKAGLKSGDVIVDFNGKPVLDSRHLKLEVARTQPGTTVPVKIVRNGKTTTLDVKLEELPGSPQLAQAGSPGKDTGTLNGVGVADLDDQARQQFGIPDDVKGAVVTDVAPDSASADAGLRPGDVIEQINRNPVKSSEDAVRLTEHPKDKVTLLRIWSNGGSRFLVVDESKAG
jgi:serine protease Do